MPQERPGHVSLVEVPLSGGRFALVSPEDAERVLKHKWSATMNAARGREKWYAHRKERGADGKRRTVYLHRFLMDPPAGMVVDHINANGLDNRRENLRVISVSSNLAHCAFKPGHTGVEGVTL